MSSRFNTENANNTRENVVFRPEATYLLHTKTPATMIDAPCRQLIGPSATHVSILLLIRETRAPPRSKASLRRKGKSSSVDMHAATCAWHHKAHLGLSCDAEHG
jgi:hypothetical protein